ncbi:MAG: DUF2505 domain-containing protein [Woeseiaceae bacterium]|nr:DUF2505 domain-containing protein [Woeseiaceae bacterium]
MKVRRDHEYAHGTDAVYALFTDEQEIDLKQQALGAREIEIEECEVDDDGADVRFIRELPADVPGILKKFLQPWNTVEQTEQWQRCDDGVYEADLTIDIRNVPVTVKGTLKLEPTGDGCVNHVRLTIESGIPFVGKTLAEFVAVDCKRLIRDEFEYITERLESG